MPDIGRFIEGDPLAWAAWLMARRLFHKTKSLAMSWVLDAPGAFFGPGCHIQGAKYIRFGKNFSANKNLWLEAVTSYGGNRYSPRLILGERIHLSDNVHISCLDRVEIGNDVLMGSSIYISDASHGAYHGAEQSPPSEPPVRRRLTVAGQVTIEDNVFIGDQVVILGPARIGQGAIIGAKSFVRGDVPQGTVVGGMPARPLKYYNEPCGTWDRA